MRLRADLFKAVQLKIVHCSIAVGFFFKNHFLQSTGRVSVFSTHSTLVLLSIPISKQLFDILENRISFLVSA